MGVADLIFAAMFYGTGRKFHVPRAQIFFSVLSGMILAITIVFMTGIALPVTPFIVLTVCLGNGGLLLAEWKAEQS